MVEQTLAPPEQLTTARWVATLVARGDCVEAYPQEALALTRAEEA